MYKNTNSKTSPKRAYSSSPKHNSSRPYRGNPSGSNSSSRRISPKGNMSNNNRSRYPARKRGGSFDRIDVSRFVNKAGPIQEAEVYVPKHTFSDFKIDERIKATIAKKGYIYPSPIQDQALPEALSGRDIIGIADTGTGKTAAFLIPLINKVLKNMSETVIIMAPTRELAIQIEREFNDLANGLKIYATVCVGGAPINMQIKNLRRGCSFVIGTPGRLLDLVKRGEIVLSSTKSVVLDEADRMLDMGFINDIKFLIAQTHPDRQNLFFSATLPREIEQLINDFTKSPVKVAVKKRDTSANVDQDIVRIGRGEDKIEKLHDLLTNTEMTKVVIFSEMKHAVEKLSVELIKRGFKAGSIHGDKRHNDRQRTLKKFKDNEINILVATDVAARGLDIPEVSHVINYEVPQTYDTYIHRIGRTGRAGRAGKALTFVS